MAVQLSDVSFLPTALQDVHAEFVAFLEEVKRWEDSLRVAEGAQEGASGDIPGELAARVRARSRALGFFGKTQPREFGGTPAGPLELVMLQETLGHFNLLSGRHVLGPSPGVLARATGRLREEYLEPLMRGEKRGAFGFTEPSSPVEPTAPGAPRRTVARVVGDELVISGQKSYVSGGDRADFVSVMLRVEGAGGESLGSAMVVVDRDLPGVEIREVFETMDGSTHAYMLFRGVRVPAWHVVGKLGEGLPRALAQIGSARAAVSAECVGLARFVLEFVRRQVALPRPGRGGPLADAEGVKLRVADMLMDACAARGMLYRVAMELERGGRPTGELMVAKVHAPEMLGRVVDQGLQLCGGMALRKGHPLERLYRLARTFRFTEGASDLLRLQPAENFLMAPAGPAAKL